MSRICCSNSGSTATAEAVVEGHRSRLAPGPYIRLSVADTGTGMDEATIARAVEPFFSTKGIGKGTGLGLSMVHGLASQLGGALTIQSRVGMGTNIELWLPVSSESADQASSPNRVSTDFEDRGKALLVDDEELVRMSTAEMLVDLGYAVIEASSAEEAVKMLAEGQPIDVLITDHLMPGMTGTELARHVQQGRPELPVLLVSGHAELEGVDANLPRLTKPFRAAGWARPSGRSANMNKRQVRGDGRGRVNGRVWVVLPASADPSSPQHRSRPRPSSQRHSC